jgi:tartrate dehydrogenase/decarboxylase / D-malate dehydrogenase
MPPTSAHRPAVRMLSNPGSPDVVLASKLLTEVGAASQGGNGMSASVSVAPDTSVPGLFGSVYGSPCAIVREGIANPIGAIWSAAMVLDYLGENAASEQILAAIADVVIGGTRTRTWVVAPGA